MSDTKQAFKDLVGVVFSIVVAILFGVLLALCFLPAANASDDITRSVFGVDFEGVELDAGVTEDGYQATAGFRWSWGHEAKSIYHRGTEVTMVKTAYVEELIVFGQGYGEEYASADAMPPLPIVSRREEIIPPEPPEPVWWTVAAWPGRMAAAGAVSTVEAAEENPGASIIGLIAALAVGLDKGGVFDVDGAWKDGMESVGLRDDNSPASDPPPRPNTLSATGGGTITIKDADKDLLDGVDLNAAGPGSSITIDIATDKPAPTE